MLEVATVCVVRAVKAARLKQSEEKIVDFFHFFLLSFTLSLFFLKKSLTAINLKKKNTQINYHFLLVLID